MGYVHLAYIISYLEGFSVNSLCTWVSWPKAKGEMLRLGMSFRHGRPSNLRREGIPQFEVESNIRRFSIKTPIDEKNNNYK